MICKIGKSLAEIENFLKEKYIQEMVLVFTVGENVHYPATSLMMFVGFLVERYETENVPKLLELSPEPVEEDPVESDDEWEILKIRDLIWYYTQLTCLEVF